MLIGKRLQRVSFGMPRFMELQYYFFPCDVRIQISADDWSRNPEVNAFHIRVTCV
jgi:hypothetical protein